MSAAGGLGAPAGNDPWLVHFQSNARATLATLMRAPRGTAIVWPAPARLALGASVAIVVIVAAMFVLDAWSINLARRLPADLSAAANRFTDFGKSGWFLFPLGGVLLVLATLDSPAMPRFPRGVLAAWSVRLGFVFVAIGLPGLFVTIIKRLIGRARPFVAGDVWTYEPFSWHPAYASLPSGHATNAFAALVAMGAIFPQARALLWIYAVLIAFSRVAVMAHHPSDVVAGAIVGTIGAFLVRDWFAARRLGFTVGTDGSVRAMPAPGLPRIIKAVARRFHSA